MPAMALAWALQTGYGRGSLKRTDWANQTTAPLVPTRSPEQVRKPLLELLTDVGGATERMRNLVKQRAEKGLRRLQLIALDDDPPLNLIPDPNGFVVVVKR